MQSLFMARSALLIAAATLGVSAPALAAIEAPDPFQDYATSHPEAPPVEPIAQPPRAASADAAPGGLLVPVRRGAWQIGGFGTFAYAGSNSDLLGGGEESNRNLFFRLSPTFKYLVLDQVEIGGSIGLLTKSINREGKTISSESDFLFEATGSYLIPLGSRFAFAPGAGLGLYFGESARPVTINGNEVDETTSTRGVALSLYPMVAYQLTPDWQLRSGISVTLLYGSELVKSADQRLATSAAYISFPIQVSYTFR